MMQYFSFWAVWFGFWITIICLQLALYAIAISKRSREIANDMLNAQRQPNFSRIFSAASALSSLPFGPRLFTLRAFGVSFLLSLSVFAIAFSVAALATPDFLEFYKWDDTTFPLIAARITFITTGVMIILGLAFEFIYVTKTRFVFRLIRSSMTILQTVTLWSLISLQHFYCFLWPPHYF